MPPASMMEAVGQRHRTEDPHTSHGSRHPKTPVGHTVVREDVSSHVCDSAKAHPNQNRTTEDDECRRAGKRPKPKEVVPNDSAISRLSMMRPVLTPEGPVKHETMHGRHHRLGNHESAESHGELGEHGRNDRRRLSLVQPLGARRRLPTSTMTGSRFCRLSPTAYPYGTAAGW